MLACIIEIKRSREQALAPGTPIAVVERAGFEPAYGKPGQIYSLLPLTTRPPLQVSAGARNGDPPRRCQPRGDGRRAFVAPFKTGLARHGLKPLALLGRSMNDHAPGMALNGAGEGNRTLVISLEGFCSTIELHPPEGSAAAALPLPTASGQPPGTTPLASD